MDYATLKSLRPSDFEDAADGYRATSDMASQAKDDLENQIAAKMQEQLEGKAVDAAVKQLRKVAANFHYTQVECGVVATALNALAQDLQEAKNKLDAAVAEALSVKFTVGSDGSVSYPAAGEEVDGEVPKGGTAIGSVGGRGTNDSIDPVGDANDTAGALGRQAGNSHPNPNYGRAVTCANRIAQAIHEATEADNKWAPKLRKLKADDDLAVSNRDWTDVQKDTREVRKGAADYLSHIKAPPKDSLYNASWWKGLSDQEKADYISMYPASIGAIDGIPADVRDEANRVVLAEKRADYQIRRDAIPDEPKPRSMNNSQWLLWAGKYKTERDKLDAGLSGMRAIQGRFDRTGEGRLPEAYLLGFDPEANKDGRVILANGNPDTADHTAVFVPGTKTVLGNIEDEVGKSDALWRQSTKVASGESVSTIMWFDYDAPRSAKPGESGDVRPEAMYDKYAERAAPRLRGFLDGIELAHQEAAPPHKLAPEGHSHVTLIGHSYGSTVIGDVAQEHDFRNPLPVDDIVAVGSPGVQADRAGDLGVQPKHVWAMGGGGDDELVREGGRIAGLGDNWTIPTDEAFGANVMESDSGSHGGFWAEERGKASLSLKNQANVIVGNYSDVSLKSEAHW